MIAGKECWLLNIQNILHKVPMGTQRWQYWLEAFEANRKICCIAYTVNVDESTNHVEVKKTRWEDETYKALHELAINR